jgi:serine/threonine protein phosphatase PrpC
MVGVIATPEITEMNFVAGDQFIVIASDGVWEFISNEEVAAIVMPFY